MSRKKTEEYLYKVLDYVTLSKNGNNAQWYRNYLSGLSDKEFKQWLDSVVKGDIKISFTIPNNNKERVSLEAIIELCKKIKTNLFTKLIYETKEGKYISPTEVLVIDLPIRIMSQMLSKKRSIAKDDSKIDNLTGQATGISKTSSLSSAELNVLVGLGLNVSSKELLKYRGGDLGGYAALKAYGVNTGRISQNEIKRYATGVESAKSMKIYLAGKHIGTNF